MLRVISRRVDCPEVGSARPWEGPHVRSLSNVFGRKHLWEADVTRKSSCSWLLQWQWRMLSLDRALGEIRKSVLTWVVLQKSVLPNLMVISSVMGITVLTYKGARTAQRGYAPCPNRSSAPEILNSIARKLRAHPLPYPVALAWCVRCRTCTGEDVQDDDF